MHITAPRILATLMFLGLIGYAFFLAPWLETPAASRAPAAVTAVTAVTSPEAHPAASAPAAVRPRLPARAPLSRAE